MKDYQTRLKKISEVLLDTEENYLVLKNATDDLYELFVECTSLDTVAEKNREDVHLAQGKAIGPTWAAMCVKEFMRTKRFIRGLYLAIQEAMRRFTARPIQVLYAGTGPFATLALPLTTVFSPAEVNFTCLEINPISIQVLEQVLDRFEVRPYIKEIICCDATTYTVAPDQSFQLMITETMQNALQKEPHVGITLNLLPQLCENGIFIPENIIIEAVAIHPKKDLERMMGLIPSEMGYHYLGTVFELNQQSSQAYYTTDNAKYDFPIKELDLRQIPEGYSSLSLMTRIQVFAGEELSYWQCSLNLPQRIAYLETITPPANSVSFQYQLNEKPGFIYHLK